MSLLSRVRWWPPGITVPCNWAFVDLADVAHKVSYQTHRCLWLKPKQWCALSLACFLNLLFIRVLLTRLMRRARQVPLLSRTAIDWGLMLTGIPLCLLARAANIFPLSAALNTRRRIPLPRNLQVRDDKFCVYVSGYSHHPPAQGDACNSSSMYSYALRTLLALLALVLQL